MSCCARLTVDSYGCGLSRYNVFNGLVPQVSGYAMELSACFTILIPKLVEKVTRSTHSDRRGAHPVCVYTTTLVHMVSNQRVCLTARFVTHFRLLVNVVSPSAITAAAAAALAMLTSGNGDVVQ